MKAATRRHARGAIVQPISRSAITPPVLTPTIDRSTPIELLPQLLRISEAASWADCSEGVLYEEIKRGRLAHVKLGRLLRVPRNALAAWLDQ
jgi:excisionase family DNA binding protein